MVATDENHKAPKYYTREHYEQERGPDGSLELFRWTDQDRKTLGKKKLDEIINRWREDVKKGAKQ